MLWEKEFDFMFENKKGGYIRKNFLFKISLFHIDIKYKIKQKLKGESII